jgi:Icc-related predicted phosphoesterase
MQIYATSDLHGALPDIHEQASACDVVVIAGDVAPDVPVAQQLAWLDGPFRNWLAEFDRRVIGIAGNHDFVFEKWGAACRELMLPWTYLEDSGTEHDGVRIWGLPWVPNLSNWAFHADDHRLDLYYDQVPLGTHVVVSHGPPQFHCDKTVPRYGSQNAGTPVANGMLLRVRPQAFICGHIHEGYGTATHRSKAVIYNVALNDENYDPINPPMVVNVTYPPPDK